MIRRKHVRRSCLWQRLRPRWWHPTLQRSNLLFCRYKLVVQPACFTPALKATRHPQQPAQQHPD
jgi:hypothetical protein